MSIEVELPDGTVVEFPDDTPPEVMKAALARQFGSSQQQPPQIIPGSSIAQQEQAALARQEAPYDPAADSSALDNFRAGIGKSFYDTGRGLGQMLGIVSQEEIDRAAELDAPLSQSGGGLLGGIVGHSAQIALPGTALVRYGKAIPGLAQTGRVMLNPSLVTKAPGFGGTLARIGTASGIGAIQAGTQPVVSGDTRLENMVEGGMWGAGGQSVASLLGSAGRVVSRARAGGRDSAAEAIERAASDPATVARLRSGNVEGAYVPGSAPTTAESTRDIGLAGLERTLRTDPRFAPRFREADEARNLARVSLIRRQFRGATPEDAAAIRTSVAEAQGPAIREAMRQTGAETGKIISWIDRVAKSDQFRGAEKVQAALSNVRQRLAQPIDDKGRLSAARGIVTEFLASPKRMSSADFDAVKEARRIVFSAQNAGSSADEALAAIRKLKPSSVNARSAINDIARALRVTEKGRPDVATLYNTRKDITQTIMPGADPAQVRALKGVVQMIDAQIAKAAPTYKQYLRDYAAGMREADQAQVGATLLGYGMARPSAGVGEELTTQFVNRSRNMDRVVQSATGFGRARANKVLTPQQLAAVEAVRKDLDRFGYVRGQSRASLNSITAEASAGQEQLARLAGGVAAAKTGGLSSIAMAAVADMRAKHGERVAELVYQAMQSPDRAAEILAFLPADQRTQIIRQAAPLLSIGFGQSAAARETTPSERRVP